MKRILRIAALLLFLLPGIAKAQWTFDIVSVEAYINDHKKQRSLLLARSPQYLGVQQQTVARIQL